MAKIEVTRYNSLLLLQATLPDATLFMLNGVRYKYVLLSDKAWADAADGNDRQMDSENNDYWHHVAEFILGQA